MENETMMRSHGRAHLHGTHLFARSTLCANARNCAKANVLASTFADVISNFRNDIFILSRHPFSCYGNSFSTSKLSTSEPSNTPVTCISHACKNAPCKLTCASSFNDRYAHCWSCLPAQRSTSCICDRMQECMVGVHSILYFSPQHRFQPRESHVRTCVVLKNQSKLASCHSKLASKLDL